MDDARIRTIASICPKPRKWKLRVLNGSEHSLRSRPGVGETHKDSKIRKATAKSGLNDDGERRDEGAEQAAPFRTNDRAQGRPGRWRHFALVRGSLCTVLGFSRFF